MRRPESGAGCPLQLVDERVCYVVRILPQIRQPLVSLNDAQLVVDAEREEKRHVGSRLLLKLVLALPRPKLSRTSCSSDML